VTPLVFLRAKQNCLTRFRAAMFENKRLQQQQQQTKAG